MGKYGPRARREIDRAMKAYKEGKLLIGNNRRKVSDRQKALSLGILKNRRASKRSYNTLPKGVRHVVS